MLRWILVLCGAGVCLGLECEAPHSSGLKFNLRSVRNESGHWIAQLQVGHDARNKSMGPWDVNIDHTTAKCEDQESILITATISVPPATPIKSPISLAAPRYQVPPATPIKSPIPLAAPKALGYELAPGLGYYKLHTDVNTWHGALEVCKSEGAHLAVPNSETEVQALKPLWDKTPDAKIVGARSTDLAWVGFHDQYKEGEFVTIFNESLKTSAYNTFKDGAGRGGTSFNCVLIHRDLKLYDYYCDQKQAFFCEREF